MVFSEVSRKIKGDKSLKIGGIEGTIKGTIEEMKVNFAVI